MYALHNHTGKSNASREFADSSIKLKDLVVKAKEKGLKGIAVTDHESVGSFIQCKNLEESENFPIICGNEIYLVTDTQDRLLREEYNNTMYYPHFILLSLDEIGNRQLRELSSIAWINSYYQKGMIRTTTKTSDIERIIGENNGHIVASTACIGGQIARWILDTENNKQDIEKTELRKRQILKFIKWCQTIFGEDYFYLECQPCTENQTEQQIVNNYILNLNKEYGIPYIITTDSHYLDKSLFELHKSFLNSSSDTEREVDEFYKTAYLMGEDEVKEYFGEYWKEEDIQLGIDNTDKIGNMAKKYSMRKKQDIPKIDFDTGWIIEKNFFPKTKYIEKMINSSFEQDKYLMYLINKGMKKLIPLKDYEETFKRIEEEVSELWEISKIINDRLGAYFVTISKLIDIMWNEGDSLVGVGRGSGVSSIIDYLLEVTQINPLKMPVEMPFYRFIDRARVELPDIDVDTQSDRRLQVFQAVKKYFEALGGEVINCCTYGTLGSKSAILNACRGLGLSSDDAQELSQLIKTERGFTWSLDDCYYGNEKENREPIKEFKNLIDKYKLEGYDIWNTAKLIEDIEMSRGTHASGVFITNGDFIDYNAKMRSGDGTITSQWDLHESEQHGLIKYDFLTTSAMTKIRYTLEDLIANGHIERKETLKETYMNVLNPMTLKYDKKEIWNSIQNNLIVDLFQFDSMVALQTLALIKPETLVQLAQTNSLLRLQAQDGKTETPTETYTRYKNDISELYKDMDKYKVPKEDREKFKDLLEKFMGVLDTQEGMMALSRLEGVTNFSIAESHELRGVIAKKKMDKIPKLKEKFYKRGHENGLHENTLNYLWNEQVCLQLGYSFSILHCIAYTFIALQEAVLYNDYPSIYWNTACLTVNSGGEEEELEGFEDEDIEGTDDKAEETKKKKKSTKYGKVAKAIGQMQQRGINIGLPDINKANFNFKADEKNNTIIYGLKGINGIGDDIVHCIVNNRPYVSFEDFLNKCAKIKNKENEITNSQIIKLIKGGCFDNLENKSRCELMHNFISTITETKGSLSMQNMEMLINYDCIPEEYNLYIRYYKFKKYILSNQFYYCDDNKYKKKHYKLNKVSEEFFNQHFISLMKENKDYYYNEEGNLIVIDKSFTGVYDKILTSFRSKVLNSQSILKELNKKLLEENINKYANGNISKWEMDSLCFYYGEHELINVDKEAYGIVNFFELSEEPVIVGKQKRKGKEWDRYSITRICGTVLDKNKTKHMITLLTIDGVVTVKFYAGAFSHYDKQISQPSNQKGKEKDILEKSWFARGNKVMITGFRRGDMFVPRVYSDSIYSSHTVALINDVREDGTLSLKIERTRAE